MIAKPFCRARFRIVINKWFLNIGLSVRCYYVGLHLLRDKERARCTLCQSSLRADLTEPVRIQNGVFRFAHLCYSERNLDARGSKTRRMTDEIKKMPPNTATTDGPAGKSNVSEK